MSREIWRQIKSSKNFNVSLYRSLGSVLVFSLSLNVLLCFWVSYAYFNRPGYVFYSTDGASPPALLAPRDTPNKSSVPLLLSDPNTGDEIKAIPQ